MAGRGWAESVIHQDRDHGLGQKECFLSSVGSASRGQLAIPRDLGAGAGVHSATASSRIDSKMPTVA